jgi:hypothetical protein
VTLNLATAEGSKKKVCNELTLNAKLTPFAEKVGIGRGNESSYSIRYRVENWKANWQGGRFW